MADVSPSALNSGGRTPEPHPILGAEGVTKVGPSMARAYTTRFLLQLVPSRSTSKASSCKTIQLTHGRDRMVRFKRRRPVKLSEILDAVNKAVLQELPGATPGEFRLYEAKLSRTMRATIYFTSLWALLKRSIFWVLAADFVTWSAITYLNLFPEFLLGSTMGELLKLVIQVAGILIGMNGLIFTQIILSINNREGSILLELLKEPSRSELREELMFALLDLRKKRRAALMELSLVATLLGLSMLTAISAMSKIIPVAQVPRVELSLPILFLLSGLIFGIVLMAQTDWFPAVENKP